MTRNAWVVGACDGPNGTWTATGYDEFLLQSTAFVEKVDLECRLLANPLFWWLITASNLAIASCLTGMVLTAESAPLVTVGDMIESFLVEPSASIPRSACTYDYYAFKNMFKPEYGHRECKLRTRRWYRAAGFRRWGLTTLLMFLVGLLVSVAFSYSLQHEDEVGSISLNVIFGKGLASLSQASTISRTFAGNTTMAEKLGLIVLANAPQPAITLLYLLYSSLFTDMLAEHEWHQFGRRPGGPPQQPLRVSQPRG
ncbi:hypothetical protein B0T22DRAFT_532509 [Podospora appendiculata]|uniref:Uncharacterized protein n=1 Tax=Podospora appendiculata TaxID=314037 RepID=A0AAE0XH82_9PEZI|nr:hypothetical protein B0T22DRAFT_532509 [Podospora appendiculata]